MRGSWAQKIDRDDPQAVPVSHKPIGLQHLLLFSPSRSFAAKLFEFLKLFGRENGLNLFLRALADFAELGHLLLSLKVLVLPHFPNLLGLFA